MKGKSWEAGGATITWDMVQYDVQLLGGVAIHEGRVAEMKTGERKALKRKFSYLFQNTALFDFLNIYENIALPLKERTSLPDAEIKHRVLDKMYQLDLHKIDDSYPSQISGGMKKRVALARALVTNPEIVVPRLLSWIDEHDPAQAPAIAA